MRNTAVRRHSRVCVRVIVGVLLLAAALAGCTSSTPLPDDPTADQVVAAAVAWIEAEDCQAIKAYPDSHPVKTWAYRKGGAAAVGFNGSVVIAGNRLYIAIGGMSLLPVPGGAGGSHSGYLEISAADFPDRASVQSAEAVFLPAWVALLSDPYHALKYMRPDGAVERSDDGSSLTVRGIVRGEDLYRPIFGPATQWAMDLGYLPPFEIPVTLTVDGTGRPLQTNVAYFGDLVTAQWFAWVRGVWEIDPAQVVTVQEYLSDTTTVPPMNAQVGQAQTSSAHVPLRPRPTHAAAEAMEEGGMAGRAGATSESVLVLAGGLGVGGGRAASCGDSRLPVGEEGVHRRVGGSGDGDAPDDPGGGGRRSLSAGESGGLLTDTFCHERASDLDHADHDLDAASMTVIALGRAGVGGARAGSRGAWSQGDISSSGKIGI